MRFATVVGGSDTAYPVRYADHVLYTNPGVYMEVLEKELQKRNMEIPIVTMKEAVQLLNN